MRAREFLLEYNLKVSKDADGVAIKATAGAKQLGHAEFFFDKQGRLDPQTVWVDERFHGQGIAADMYDHLKGLGYTIVRSWDQTDAGRGFWNKHRGSDAKVWENQTKQATAKQVLAYINRTHHEPMTAKLVQAVMAHPQWQLKRVPLLNLNIPDEEYDDVEQEPESDPYGRVMAVDPGHAGEVSQHIIDKRPIVIDADRYIIDGNHRAWAAKYLLNRDSIMAWIPVEQLAELNYPDELNVSDALQQYFVRRGYQVAGEGRDQIAFESPRGTVVKVLGIGEQEREDIVKRYVEFFLQHQRNPYYPRIYNTGNFKVGDETYFVYEMEYLNYIADEEEVLEYIEDLMSAAARGPEAVRAYQQNRPLPKSLPADEIQGLLQATYELEAAIGGQAPLDLSMIENIRRRANGHIVIMDPYSL